MPNRGQRWLGKLVSRYYDQLPKRDMFLRLATKLEGGEMYSDTLRAVLRDRFGVTVGKYSYGSLLTIGMADRGTVIGSYVSIGPNVRRLGASHPLDKPSLHPFWYNPRLGFASSAEDVVRTGCEIGSDSWIGANVVILPSCARIGVGAVIGAGSVVTKDVEDFTIVVGNPARPIRKRLTSTTRAQILSMDPWSKEPADARQILEEISSELDDDA
jgi:virginiamycin A acetyltransferase